MSRRGGQGDAMRVVQHVDDEEDEAESSEDEEEGDSSDEAAVSDGGEEEEEGAAAATVPRRRATQTPLPAGPLAPTTHAAPRAKIKLSFAAAKAAAIAAGGCKACGSMEHTCGFVGSVYQDCPSRACFLCKGLGHTTATCPFRSGVPEAAQPAASRGAGGALRRLRMRETRSVRPGCAFQRSAVEYAPPKDWRVTAAVLKLHSRRVTALEFHPTRSSLLVSGDKRGQLALWSHAHVTDKTVVERGIAHQWLISAIRFLPSDLDYLYSSSVDGTVVKTHCDTAQSLRVGTLNPGMVWTDDDSQDWRSAYSMDVDASRNALLVGDDMGQVHLVDPRASSIQGRMQAAKRRNKIVSVSWNSVDSNLFCVAGNDHFARVWDVRRVSTNGASSSEAGLTTAQSNKALSLALATMAHPRVVSSALFSPVTGRKMLTTCTDNRLRVWDNLASCNGPPAQEIVHSHDFSRYLSPFRAVWDPKDLTESCVAIGRYISEDFGGTALHPIDIFSASTGRAMCVLTDINVQTICPVVAICPSHDIIAVGSSRNLFVWEPVPPEDEADDAVRLADEARGKATQAAAARYAPRMLDLDEGKKKGGKKAREDDDDDDDEPFGKKKGKRE